MLTEDDVLFAPKPRLTELRPTDETVKLVEKMHRVMVAECRRRIAGLVNDLYGHRLAAAGDLHLKVPFPLSPRLDLEPPEKGDIDAFAAEHAKDLYAQIEDHVREALSRHFDTIERRHYAFIFSGKDDYGRAAEAYVRQWLPDHRLGWASTFEEMFAHIAAELAADRRSGHPVRISEIVVITHGYAGGLLVPLTKEDRKKEDAFRQWRREHPNEDPTRYDWTKRGHFTPEYLALVQKDQTKATAALRRARRDVLAALDERAQIIVRGCNFGQSGEGLRALRDFFGGHVETAAPVGYQGFEMTYVRPDHPVPALRSEAGAYDFLVEQGYLEGASDLTDKQKEGIIRRRFGRPSRIPAEFFVFGQESYQAEKTALKKLPPSRRSAFAKESDPYVVTPGEISDYKPLEPASGKEFEIRDQGRRQGQVWGVTPATGRRDPELDDLSRDELIARAGKLQNPYRPQHAAMLLRLYRVWERKSTIPSWDTRANKDDPLFGIHDEEKIFPYRRRFAADAALAPSPVADDRFEKGELKYRTRAAAERANAEEAGASAAARVAAATAPGAAAAVTERDFDARGRVDNLPDGGLRLWNFPVNSADLRSQFKQPLVQLARRVSARMDVTLTIEGHTSSSGDEPRNEGLATARAQQVVALLQAAGVPAQRMAPTGYGERRPLVAERKAEAIIPRNMAQNRRVEIHLVKVTPPSAPTPAKPAGQVPAKAPKSQPGPTPTGLIDAIEFKKNIKIPGTARKKVGVLLVTVEGKITLQGKIGLRDAGKTLKLTPDEKKVAFEAAFQSDLGRLKIEGEVQDGKPSQIKLGLDVTEWLTIDFAANSDFTKPFQLDIKNKPVDVTLPVGDWTFRGRVYVTLSLYFGPDPKVAASLAARGGRAILRVVARGGAAAHGLLFTELGAVTTVGAVTIGVGVVVAGVVWLGFVLYQIGEAHKEGRWLAAGSQFAWGYGHMLMQLTAYETVINQPMKDTVARRLSIDWKREFKEKVKQWIDDENKAALDRIYYLGEAAAANDYNMYVKVYGEKQWTKLTATHRHKYGEDFQARENRYNRIVYNQVKERESTFGVPLEANP
jgi:outer membrane protein OmpA-like peptidoglycan-associated protein